MLHIRYFTALPRALPQRFRRPRLLIVGAGDIGMRIVRRLHTKVRPPRIYALTRKPELCLSLRHEGIIPIVGDLDHKNSLKRLRGLARSILHLAPPPNHGTEDTRTRNLLTQLFKQSSNKPYRLIYLSTTGIYGDCAGQLIDETRPPHPQSMRAKRRVAAENQLRRWAQYQHARLTILRVPGIYADDRLPLDRIRKGIPIFREEEDIYTNHIHAEDLARLCWLGLFRGQPNRVYNACDNIPLALGIWYETLAQLFGLPLPPRLTRLAVQQQVTEQQWSFLRESRRIKNTRLRKEWRLQLAFPDALDFCRRLRMRLIVR